MTNKNIFEVMRRFGVTPEEFLAMPYQLSTSQRIFLAAVLKGAFKALRKHRKGKQ